MTPSDDDLEIKDARADKASRRWLALILALSAAPAVHLLIRGPLDGWMVPLALASATLGILVAWRAGMVARGRVLLGLGAIRRAGLAATELLTQGDVEGAQRGYVALLKPARPLGAYHATHVMLYGVTRFFQGDTNEGLRLVTRALDSGWFSGIKGQHFRAVGETWRILMLLTSGQTAEARQRLAAFPDVKRTSAGLLMAIVDEQWQSALDGAKQALADSDTPKAGRPTIAALGRYAARKLAREDDVAAFEKVLEAEPLAAIAKLNPAFRARLD